MAAAVALRRDCLISLGWAGALRPPSEPLYRPLRLRSRAPLDRLPFGYAPSRTAHTGLPAASGRFGADPLPSNGVLTSIVLSCHPSIYSAATRRRGISSASLLSLDIANTPFLRTNYVPQHTCGLLILYHNDTSTLSSCPHALPRTRWISQRPRLGDNQRQQAVDSHFADASKRNIVQPSVPLKPAKQTFYSSPAIVRTFKIWSFNDGGSLLMGRIGFDNRLRSVLTLDKLTEGIAAVPRVTRHGSRVELTIGISRLPQKRRCHLHVGNIPRCNADCQWQLPSRVRKYMCLVPPHELLASRGVEFNAPPGVGIASRGFSSIAPRLDVSSVYSNGLTETTEGVVTLPSQTPHDVLHPNYVSRPSQLPHEPRVSERGIKLDLFVKTPRQPGARWG